MNERKLNLGCGNRLLEDYLNVDKYGTPDEKVDLEKFPWPWKDDSFDTILLNHVLEHLGQNTDIFLGIMKELYRVSCNNSRILIVVPHPRSDAYLEDPTHVRPITPGILELFSKKKNQMYREKGLANTPLAEYLDIDLEIVKNDVILDSQWRKKYERGELSLEEIHNASRSYNNVIFKYEIELKVIK